MRWALVILAALLLVGCAKGCGGDRPAAPTHAPPAAPGQDAPASEREAYWRRQVAEAQAQLAVARSDAQAAEEAAWRTWTRWIGLAGIALAVGVGSALSLLVTPKLGVPVGIIVALTALSVVAYGATVRWLPLALLGTAGLAAGVWALYHLRHLHVATAASRALDAIEVGSTHVVRDAKRALGSAIDRAALRPRLDRRRGPDRRWGQV